MPSATIEDKQPPKAVTLVAQIILAAAGVACVLVFLYFFYYYGWTRQRQFGSWAGPLLYFVFPAAFAILSFASMRLRPSVKVSLALLLFSVGVSVGGLEILMSVWFSLPSVIAKDSREATAKIARSMGVDYDTRSRRDVLRDLLREGKDAVPSVFPQAFFKGREGDEVRSPLSSGGAELMPLGGISNKLVVLCNEGGQYVTFRSDEHGFNNPPSVWDARPIDIVAVGDSYVQGYCVDNIFVNIIRTQYPSTLNLGIEGDGPLTMLATLKEYAAAVKPRIVLWCYYEGNDLADLTTERKSALLRRYLSPGFSQNLISKQDEIDRLVIDFVAANENKSDARIKVEELRALFGNVGQLTDLRQLRNRVEGVVKLTQLRTRLGLVYGTATSAPASADAGPPNQQRMEWLQSQMDLSYEILSEAKRSVDGWGGKLYFVFLPQYYRYAPDFQAVPDRDAVLSVAKRAGLPIIDLNESFKNHADPLSLFPFRMAGHYNAEGNRLVAEHLLRSISTAN